CACQRSYERPGPTQPHDVVTFPDNGAHRPAPPPYAAVPVAGGPPAERRRARSTRGSSPRDSRRRLAVCRATISAVTPAAKANGAGPEPPRAQATPVPAVADPAAASARATSTAADPLAMSRARTPAAAVGPTVRSTLVLPMLWLP